MSKALAINAEGLSSNTQQCKTQEHHCIPATPGRRQAVPEKSRPASQGQGGLQVRLENLSEKLWWRVMEKTENFTSLLLGPRCAYA